MVALAPDGGYSDYDDAGGFPARPEPGGRTSRVRPYTLTRGRTRYGHVLLVKTLVTTLDCPQDQTGEDPNPQARRRGGGSSYICCCDGCDCCCDCDDCCCDCS